MITKTIMQRGSKFVSQNDFRTFTTYKLFGFILLFKTVDHHMKQK